MITAGRIATTSIRVGTRRAAASGAGGSRRAAASGAGPGTGAARPSLVPSSVLSSVAALTARLPALPVIPRSDISKYALGLGGGLVLAGLHSATGSANDFYDYRFESPKNPDDLASFYGGEELMELFCIFPMVGQIMMRNARFDDTGNVITTGFPGQMKVSMVFTDEPNDKTGETDWFNKRERFRNTLFGYTCWDMVLNFGFRTLEDGRKECYHYGEYFHGAIPVLSQVMLVVFKIHARWVVWSTEHHINHYAFAADAETEDWRDLRDEQKAMELEHDSRANMPMFLLRKYAFSDLLAMITGSYNKEKQPSFLVTEKETDDKANENEVWKKIQERSEVDPKAAAAKNQGFPLWQLMRQQKDDDKDKLPFQRKAVQIQIEENIQQDKRAMKELLARHQTHSGDDVKDVLARRHTMMVKRRTMARRTTMLAKRMTNANGGKEVDAAELEKAAAELEVVEEEDLPVSRNVYVMAKDLARDRAEMRSLTRQRTMRMPKSLKPKKIEEEDVGAAVAA